MLILKSCNTYLSLPAVLVSISLEGRERVAVEECGPTAKNSLLPALLDRVARIDSAAIKKIFLV